jgi:preprotein translocase subunit SecA
MASSALLAPTLRLARTAFAEREDPPVSIVDRWAMGVLAALRLPLLTRASREVAAFARQYERQGEAIASLSDRELAARLRACAPAALGARRSEAAQMALVCAAEAARRTLGLRPYPVQLAAAAVLLRGRLAEMQTGEGKTLTAGLAACVAACAGVPVHVATVNDYLAGRDSSHLQPLFDFVGLSTGIVRHEMPPADKRAAYACDITYGTGKDMVFDYLRDRVDAGSRASEAQIRARALYGTASEPPMMRGLHLAIVDEADSILIDEARTPLILARKAGAIEHAEAFPRALALARSLSRDDDFRIEVDRRDVRLTQRGRERVAETTRDEPGPWRAEHAREHLATQALRALYLFERDQHYLVDPESGVQIIDEYTGRVLEGRTWEQGLHQMIECKEGVESSERTLTMARITYQRFYGRYLRLAGMTGTARERARELAVSYRLDTIALSTHRPSRRRVHPARICRDETSKWDAVAEEVARRQATGQPVLIGTRSLAASEALSRALSARSLEHQVLNARQDAEEAALIARAGERGCITVATNMAGRGTDIVLGEGVEALGGLLVILTEFHESARIDRQLVGRCARQGQPGEAMAIVAVDDELWRRHVPLRSRLLAVLADRHPRLACLWLAYCRRAAQARAERMDARTRRDTTEQDRQLERSLGFSGDPH